MKIKSLFGVFLLVAVAGLVGCESGTDEPDAVQEAVPAGEQPQDIAVPAEEQPQDIVDTAVAAGDFSTLAAALQAGELIETLKSEGPFTVFAPTDAAFAKLPEGTVENLLKPENKEQLVAILTFHVVPGKVDSTAVSSLKTATTVNGAEIAIDVSSGGVKINDATVTTADIACSNGIIHVIDQVLIPQEEK